MKKNLIILICCILSLFGCANQSGDPHERFNSVVAENFTGLLSGDYEETINAYKEWDRLYN